MLKEPAAAGDRMKLGQRILDLADELARWSEQSDALTCTFFSEAHLATARQLRDWFAAAGLAAGIDPAGNVVGRLPGASPDARTLIIGSHYDTVRNAGKYDGRLGILCGLAVLESLRDALGDARLPFAVELIGFSEEEGVRFGQPYLGSGAVTGRLPASILDARDASGLRLGEVLAAAGEDPGLLPSIARRREDVLAYIEVHIEQGPVLLNADTPIGIVTAIAGAIRYALAIDGVAGHAGTVPMDARHDALLAAAEIALFVERRVRAEPGLVGTVGRFEVPDGAVNVIAKRCEFTLDIRSQDDGRAARALTDILDEAAAVAARRGVRLSAQELLRTKAVPCAPRLQRLFEESIERAALPVRRLPSGAGHDAVMFDGFTDIGMLFVRCGNGGISHNPLETVTARDAGVAAQILRDALLHIQN